MIKFLCNLFLNVTVFLNIFLNVPFKETRLESNHFNGARCICFLANIFPGTLVSCVVRMHLLMQHYLRRSFSRKTNYCVGPSILFTGSTKCCVNLLLHIKARQKVLNSMPVMTLWQYNINSKNDTINTNCNTALKDELVTNIGK